MFGTITDRRVAVAVGDLFGEASKSVRSKRSASLRDEQLGERAREETSDTADLVRSMKEVIDSRIHELSTKLGPGRTVEIEFYTTNLPVSDEELYGADIAVRVYIRTPRFNVTKGVLFQCKRMYGPFRKGQYTELDGRGERQAKKMLHITPASFFLLFNSGSQEELLKAAGAPLGSVCPFYCERLPKEQRTQWPCECITGNKTPVFDMGIAVLPATRVYAASREAELRSGKISTRVADVLPGTLPFGIFMVDLLGSCFIGDIRDDVVQLVTPPKLRDPRATGLPTIPTRDFPIRYFLDMSVTALED